MFAFLHFAICICISTLFCICLLPGNTVLTASPQENKWLSSCLLSLCLLVFLSTLHNFQLFIAHCWATAVCPKRWWQWERGWWWWGWGRWGWWWCLVDYLRSIRAAWRRIVFICLVFIYLSIDWWTNSANKLNRGLFVYGEDSTGLFGNSWNIAASYSYTLQFGVHTVWVIGT